MSKRSRVKPDTISKFIALVEAGTTKRAAAAAVGRDLNTIRLWLKRHNIEMPSHDTGITSQVMSHADDYRTGLLTQSQIAERCGCSKPYVSRLLHQHTDDHIRNRQMTWIHKILDHIKEHGGYPQKTAWLLGVSFDSSTFYRYIREEGIDLSKYQPDTRGRTTVKATD